MTEAELAREQVAERLARADLSRLMLNGLDLLRGARGSPTPT